MTSQIKVPILMYHALVEKRTPHLNRVHITVELFKQQMEWLAAKGYQAIIIDDMLKNFAAKKNTQKYCVITFDDGYLSLYKYALPLLKQYGFAATLYLSTAAVGENDFKKLPSLNSKTLPVDDKPLCWDEIKEMSNNGWAIESHSVSHADNSQLTAAQLIHEITDSKKIIEQQLQKPVLHYAFPFGKYNAASLKLIKETGYKTATTVHAGLCTAKSNLYRLPRLEMNVDDTLSSFIKKIETGFISPKEKIRSSARNILFSNPKVKDISKKFFKKGIN
jgi:peptidoglycan/xylan/chitin deacetylase (PgdA/CDA1 family)